MSENHNSSASGAAAAATTAPLLEYVGGGDAGGGGGKQRWWRRLVDVEEARKQVLFGLPMILTNVCYFAITLVSVMFAGHLGDLQLAGATLANSWVAVTGLAVMIGQSGALETLCGQGYGAKMYRMLGIYLQASSIISLFFSIIISIIWVFTEPILVLLHQSHDISKEAALYIKYLIPGIFAYGFLQNILRFLQTQSVVWPLVVCSCLPLLLHFGISYALVYVSPLGYKGAPLSASISLWISLIMLVVYVKFSKRFKDTWKGFSSESFSYVFSNLKLALPSAAMVCLEYWAFEILVLLAGLMPDPETSTSLIAMCVNTEAIAYMIAYGLSAAASTRVSNELGAGNPDRAKHAMAVTLQITLCFALAVVILLGICHNIWAGFFSSSTVIIKDYAYMTPFLVASILVDNAQGVLSGVARGCGWQQTVVYINLGTFYLIGMPVAAVLAFKLKLYPKGLWIGLICGLSCQATALLFITLRTKWERIELSVSRRKENPELIN